MSTVSSSNKKSTRVRASSVREKARLAVQRVSVSDARRLPKPRTGFEKLVAQLAKIVAKYGDDFGPSIDVERMRSSLSAYEALEDDYHAAVDHLAEVENTRLVHSSSTWVQILEIYDRARSIARTNQNMRGDIDPIVHFMKKGPRKPPVTPTTP